MDVDAQRKAACQSGVWSRLPFHVHPIQGTRVVGFRPRLEKQINLGGGRASEAVSLDTLTVLCWRWRRR